jgi:hypothetical protein
MSLVKPVKRRRASRRDGGVAPEPETTLRPEPERRYVVPVVGYGLIFGLEPQAL